MQDRLPRALNYQADALGTIETTDGLLRSVRRLRKCRGGASRNRVFHLIRYGLYLAPDVVCLPGPRCFGPAFCLVNPVASARQETVREATVGFAARLSQSLNWLVKPIQNRDCFVSRST